jgi:hypothetical protein
MLFLSYNKIYLCLQLLPVRIYANCCKNKIKKNAYFFMLSSSTVDTDGGFLWHGLVKCSGLVYCTDTDGGFLVYYHLLLNHESLLLSLTKFVNNYYCHGQNYCPWKKLLSSLNHGSFIIIHSSFNSLLKDFSCAVHVCMHLCLCTCVRVHANTLGTHQEYTSKEHIRNMRDTCVHAFVCVRVYVCMHACIYVYIHTTYKHTCVHASMHVYMYDLNPNPKS